MGKGIGLIVYDWQFEDSEMLFENFDFFEFGGVNFQIFEQLIFYFEYKLFEECEGEGDFKWVFKQLFGMLWVFIWWLCGVQKYFLFLICGDLIFEQVEGYWFDLLWCGIQFMVVDIYVFLVYVQMFVVGVLLCEVFEYKEWVGW